MKERPIIFSAPMVHALLHGHKTQTRRLLKETGTANRLCSVTADSHPINPFGHPGDRLWVKETWSTDPAYNHLKPSELNDEQLKSVRYHADGPRGGRTRSSLFLPRRASRIMLEIVNVRKERLQTIQYTDARAEGMSGPDPVTEYARPWDQINGNGSWNSNPWVWVVSFKLIN